MRAGAFSFFSFWAMATIRVTKWVRKFNLTGRTLGWICKVYKAHICQNSVDYMHLNGKTDLKYCLFQLNICPTYYQISINMNSISFSSQQLWYLKRNSELHILYFSFFVPLDTRTLNNFSVHKENKYNVIPTFSDLVSGILWSQHIKLTDQNNTSYRILGDLWKIY